jgi:hypothetical protein
MFMHDKKKKESMWLICAAHDTEIDLKALNKHLPCSSGNLRGADAESMEKFTGCKKGMVNFFSVVNDTENKVNVIVDKKIMDAEWVSFHPMDNTASTAIKIEGLLKIKEVTKRDDTNFEVIDFAAMGGGEGVAKPVGPAKAKVEQGKKMTKEEKTAYNLK